LHPEAMMATTHWQGPARASPASFPSTAGPVLLARTRRVGEGALQHAEETAARIPAAVKAAAALAL
jgi:hypothetical protein